MPQKISPARLRIGISIWVISWLPFPILIVAVAHKLGLLTNAASTSLAYSIMWAIQIIISLLGLALAGKETIALAKSDGWRRLPKRLWALIRYGDNGSSQVAPNITNR